MLTKFIYLAPYWVLHGVLSALFSLAAMAALWFLAPALAALGLLVGPVFYSVREVFDYFSPKGDDRVSEGLTRWDWPGFLAPWVSFAMLVVVLA